MQSSSCRSPTSSLYSVSFPKSESSFEISSILRYFPRQTQAYRQRKGRIFFFRRTAEVPVFPAPFPDRFPPVPDGTLRKGNKRRRRDGNGKSRTGCGSVWRRDWRRGRSCAERCARSAQAASASCLRVRGFYRSMCRWHSRRCVCCRLGRRLCARISEPRQATPCSGDCPPHWSRSRQDF